MKDIIIQTLFVAGRVTNADPVSVDEWIEKLEIIEPASVQVYSLDRVPADTKLKQVPREELEAIAYKVHKRSGIPAEVY